MGLNHYNAFSHVGAATLGLKCNLSTMKLS